MTNAEIIIVDKGKYAISGVIDKNTVTGLWQQKHQLKPSDGSLVIDLAKITHSDSAGLGLLTCLQKEAMQTNDFVSLINIPQQLQQLIELSRLEDILKG